MDRLKIWKCGQKLFSFNCPIRWEHLSSTNDPDIRFCDHCQSNVFRCATPERFYELAQENSCIAIDETLVEVGEAPLNLLGRPLPSSRALMSQARAWWETVEKSLPGLEGQLIRQFERQEMRDSSLDERIGFHELAKHVGAETGVYQIWTHSGIGLKVGIADNLRERLCKHAASRNSGLRIKGSAGSVNDGMSNLKPSDVVSKASILAKHLYFDHSLSDKFDFTTQEGRCSFLRDQCYVVVQKVGNRAEAREIELQLEKSEKFRFVGRVKER